ARSSGMVLFLLLPEFHPHAASLRQKIGDAGFDVVIAAARCKAGRQGHAQQFLDRADHLDNDQRVDLWRTGACGVGSQDPLSALLGVQRLADAGFNIATREAASWESTMDAQRTLRLEFRRDI